MILTLEGDDRRPCLEFYPGAALRHVLDNTYEWVDVDGKHLSYAVATEIVYDSSMRGVRR